MSKASSNFSSDVDQQRFRIKRRGVLPSPHLMVGFLLSYLAGSRSVSACLPDSDTMTNAALEATSSSSGTNVDRNEVHLLSLRKEVVFFESSKCIDSFKRLLTNDRSFDVKLILSKCFSVLRIDSKSYW